ncbi:MAG: hypothetical protein ABI851_12555 [Saprospiraceae bacterium]
MDKKCSRFCMPYTDQETFFSALKKEEPSAIKCLTFKISTKIFQIGIGQGLNEEDIEELICDSITTFLQKIKDEKYIFKGFDPATFVIEIAKNKSNNLRRKSIRHQTTSIQEAENNITYEDYSSHDAIEILEKILNKLDSSCQNLIRLKYLEEYKDNFIIENKLTQYTTIDSLKNNRAKCFKKLIELNAIVNL